MKIYSQNLHGYMEVDRFGKMELMADYINENNIDFICLQEVVQYVYDDIEYDNIKYSNLANILVKILKKKHNKEYFNYTDMFKLSWDRYDEGLAILSNIKPDACHSKFLSSNTKYDNWETRKAISCNFTIAGETYSIINTHLGWDTEEENFKLQVDQLQNMIDNSNYTYVAGDFNSNYKSDNYNYILGELYDLTDLHAKNLINSKTFLDSSEDVGEHTNRIDFILSNKKEGIELTHIFDSTNPVSDHLGLVFTK